MNQYETPLFDAVLDFIQEENAPFFIPSHKMGRAIHPKWKAYAGEEIFKMDLCEVQGLDDLHQPKGVIREAQQLAADAWGADHSFFLVNGTSSGIIAAICTIAGDGDKIIVPRNAHKSVVFGLIISGAVPIYVAPEVYVERGLIGGTSPKKLEEACEKHPEVKGVFGVSPTYHGICSNMSELIKVTHQHGGVFIADEAHGNHVYFHQTLPKGALQVGADFSCQSIHKMSGSLTQSSILHVKGDRIDLNRLKANLQMIQNTSPSYLLGTSLDLARSYIATEGNAILERLLQLTAETRKEIKEIPGINLLDQDIISHAAIFDYEPMRLVFSARELGIEGYELYKILRYDYGIEIEFGDYYYGICVLGLGTEKEHLDKLVSALRDLSMKHRGQRKALTWDEELPPVPPMVMKPRDAFFAKRKRVRWENAKGEISAEMIVPYPPGIPVVCPGERITSDVWDFLDKQRRNGRHLHGPEDGILDAIHVVKESDR